MGVRPLGRLPATVRAVVEEVRRENVSLLAASIAYSAFVSLLPLLVLLLFVALAVGRETLSARVVELAGWVLVPTARGVLADALANASARTGASLVGVVTLLWGTLKIFRGLDVAFSEIYDTQAQSSLLDQVTDSLVVLVALALAVVMAVAAGATFAALEEHPLVGIVNPLLLVVGLSVAFFPIYYVFPDLDLTAREVLPGVLFASVGWAVLESLFQVYVVLVDKQEVYGVLGGILLLLTWLYLGGFLLLVGGVVNAVLAGRTGTPEQGTDEPEEAPTGGMVRNERVERPEHADGSVPAAEYERLRERYDRLRREYDELADRTTPGASARTGSDRSRSGDE